MANEFVKGCSPTSMTS